MRLFERALRRTGLPLRLTGGFNPHVRLSFPLPLAVGWEAEDEVMEFELSAWVTIKEIRERLVRQMPAGVTLLSETLVRGAETAQVVEAEYSVTPISEQLQGRLSQESLDGFLKSDKFEVQRMRDKKLKSVNIRPYLTGMTLEGGRLAMLMSVSPDGTSRPEEVLEGLGFERREINAGFRVARTRVRLRGE